MPESCDSRKQGEECKQDRQLHAVDAVSTACLFTTAIRIRCTASRVSRMQEPDDRDEALGSLFSLIRLFFP